MKDQPLKKRQTFAVTFDCYFQILVFATKNNRRIWSRDVSDLLSVHRRSAQRYLLQLEKSGYLIGDKKTPIGYTPSEKLKQLFGVAA